MPLKPLLKLKRIIKGKPLTPSELGYKRDPKTERLTKPGTLKLKTKINKLIKKNFVIGGENLNPAEKRAITEIRKKIFEIKSKFSKQMKVKENARLSAIQQRQLNTWVAKLNTIFSARGTKMTVQEMKNKLFDKLYNKDLEDIFLSDYAHSWAIGRTIEEVNRDNEYDLYMSFTSNFYTEIHKSIVPTQLDKMNVKDVVTLLEKSAKVAKKEDESMIAVIKKGWQAVEESADAFIEELRKR